MDDLQDIIDYLKLEGQHKKAARLEAYRDREAKKLTKPELKKILDQMDESWRQYASR